MHRNFLVLKAQRGGVSLRLERRVTVNTGFIAYVVVRTGGMSSSSIWFSRKPAAREFNEYLRQLVYIGEQHGDDIVE